MGEKKKVAEKKKYTIEKIVYVKEPTGETYSNDVTPVYLRGKRVYNKSQLKSKSSINTTWGDLKKTSFNKSSKDKSISVRWSKPKTRIVSITKTDANGNKTITYYRPAKKSA